MTPTPSFCNGRNTALFLPCMLAMILCLSTATHAFVHPQPASSSSLSIPKRTSSTQRYLMDETEAARATFGLCFFGAVGSASLGRQALGIVWEKFVLTQSLKDQGPTQGGEVLELPWYTGYPTQDLCLQDVQSVLKASIAMTAAKIVQDHPQPNQADAFLTYEKFQEALPNENPLAVRAVFESLTVRSELVLPQNAQDSLEQYYNDNLPLLTENLIQKKVLSYSAVAILVVILGFADYFALYHLYKGWFPDWPAAVDFPRNVLDPEIGLLAIPKYWV